MRRRKNECTPPKHANAFHPQLLDELRRRDPSPAVPDGDLAGPWRVTRLWGDGPPLWACYAAGERAPRLSFEEPDLAYLAAACSERRRESSAELPRIAMKKEYDFSNAERGKFLREGARMKLPVYLDDEVRDYFQEQAQVQGVEVSRLVNDLLRREIERIESMK